MKLQNRHILALLFIATLAIRLFLAFVTPNFTYDSYFHLLQVEQIIQTGTPLFDNPFSYGGRELIFLPLFHYFSSIFALVIPLEIVAKILPNVLFASLGLVVYMIAKRLSKRSRTPLFSAFIAFFLPITFQTHAFSPLPFALLCLLFTLYFFIRARKEKNAKQLIYGYAAALILLTLSSPIASILIITLLFYALFSLFEGQKVTQAEKEIMLFSLFFFLWVQFLLFKNVFLTEGVSFIWQNIPSIIRTDYFPVLNLEEALFLVGFIPLITGVIFVYTALTNEKNKNVFLMLGILIASFALTGLRLLEFNIAIAFTGLVLAIIFAPFYDTLVEYYKKSKFSLFEQAATQKAKSLLRVKKFMQISTIVLLILLIPSMVVPSLTYSLEQEVPTQDEIELFVWLDANTAQDATIAADVREGHLVSYLSKRKNVMDPEFHLIDDVETRYTDITSLYTTHFQTHVLDIAQKYDINYIVLTDATRERLDIGQLSYRTSNCFDLVQNINNNKAYAVRCELNAQ